jgi:flagellar export protein FliJ
MKKFRFTLQPVVAVRDLQEMRARDGFAAAVREVAACTQALAQQRQRVADFVVALIERRRAGLPGVMHVSFMRSYVDEVGRERTADSALVAAERVRETARQRWIEAHLQVKLVQKLRGKARERHATEVVRFDQRQMDDRAPRGSLFPES